MRLDLPSAVLLERALLGLMHRTLASLGASVGRRLTRWLLTVLCRWFLGHRLALIRLGLAGARASGGRRRPVLIAGSVGGRGGHLHLGDRSGFRAAGVTPAGVASAGAAVGDENREAPQAGRSSPAVSPTRSARRGPGVIADIRSSA